MHSDQYPYRELHDEMPQKRGPCELDLLASWLRQYPDEVEWLQALGARSVAPVDDEGSLTREERIELLTNRCFILTDKASHDLWPFDDTFQMGEAGAAELPLEAWTR